MVKIKDLNKGIKTAKYESRKAKYSAEVKIKDLNKGIKTDFIVL